jgi:transglutaminase/protease-like cytokinesis protein 3
MVFEDEAVKNLYDKCITILDEIITPDMSDLQKETAIHDYIVTHTEYSISGNPDTLATAESVLISGYGQCQGYTEAMSLLLALSGITSRVVSGTARGSDGVDIAHAWNQVLINDV